MKVVADVSMLAVISHPLSNKPNDKYLAHSKYGNNLHFAAKIASPVYL